jgi:2-polyprenyl-3-methyl-5-hydroxy-6-metoxy-1,4-benzoquinol methylase
MLKNKMEKSEIKCLNCGSDSLLWGIKKEYKMFECSSCGLIFMYPLPNPDSVYNEDYFSGATEGFGYVDYDKDKEPMVKTFNKYLDLFAKYGKSKGSLFDVGAATGFFMNIAKSRGYEVSGVEISDYAASLGRKKGLDVKTGVVANIDIPKNSFDVVTMFDVVEHMTDPFGDLMKIKSFLKQDGLLVVNAPNGKSLMSRILKTKWHMVLPPEHIFYFSPDNLGEFLKKNGFEVLYSGTIGKRFTFQYIFKTLHKWQNLAVWDYLSAVFSKGFLADLYIPLNLHDNFFMILRKVND